MNTPTSTTTTERLIERFRTACCSIPAPGGGGCHVALLGAASKGVFAGLTDHEIHSVIRSGIPVGGRTVTDAEIAAAVRKARNTVSPADTSKPYTPPPPPRPKMPAIDYGRARSAIIAKGGGSIDPGDADLWENSPVRLSWPAGIGDTIAFLSAAYGSEEFIYIGTAYGASCNSVRRVLDWIRFFQAEAEFLAGLMPADRYQAEVELAERFPHFVANPLTGEAGTTKDGKPSYRADNCVAFHRWVVAEFDTIPKGEQIAFWRGLRVPVQALIDTGGKSVHALIRVNAASAEEWTVQIEDRMFRVLGGLGVDRACKNESRMSRLPGMRRLKQDAAGVWQDTGQFQRLLWLSLDGRTIA